MKAKELRKLIANTFSDMNMFYGVNVGDYVEDYKVNYQMPNCVLSEDERTYRIEFDVYSTDSIKVEDVCDVIEERLNYASKKITSWATFILDARYEKNEKNEFRKTLVYEVRTY